MSIGQFQPSSPKWCKGPNTSPMFLSPESDWNGFCLQASCLWAGFLSRWAELLEGASWKPGSQGMAEVKQIILPLEDSFLGASASFCVSPKKMMLGTC